MGFKSRFSVQPQGNEFRLTDLVGTLPVALRKQVPARNRSSFDAESCNHCGFPPSDHIQKRPTCPPPAKSVNLNSLPWFEAFSNSGRGRAFVSGPHQGVCVARRDGTFS